MAKKSKEKFDRKFWKVYLFMLAGIFVLVFAVFVVFFRSTLLQIGSDPSLVTLTNDGIFQVSTLINRNQNKFSDRLSECWNLKNPLDDCIEENKIVEGNYSLIGARNAKHLEGPLAESLRDQKYFIEKKYVHEVLGGTLVSETNYYQIVHVMYPLDGNVIEIEVETVNERGDSNKQTIQIQGPNSS